MKPSTKYKYTKHTTDPIFAIAAEDFKKDILSLRKIGSYNNYSRIADHLVQYFGNVKIKTIDKQDIQKYIVFLTNTKGTSAVRAHLIVFKAIMEYADDDWEMPARLKKPKTTKRRQEVYTFEEVRKLFRHSSGTIKILIALLAESGMRIGEALALQAGDIQNGTIYITRNIYDGWVQDTPKTDSSIRRFCISPTLERMLKGLMTSDPKKFLFEGPNKRPVWAQQMADELRVVCANAGVRYKPFHSFRRANVSELIVNVGVPESVVGFRIGHLTGGVTLGVYCKVQEGCDKPWIDKIEEHLYLDK